MSLREASGPFFGDFGGRYMPESLIAAIDELTSEYEAAKADPAFQAEFVRLLHTYAGRPSPITEVPRFAEHAGGARVFLKREDLNHTGSHKINNVLGQALLTRRLGKTRVIAETGAGQHGVATATAAALFGLAGGALVSGPLSDRLGRRLLLIGSVLLLGVACLGSAFSTTIGHLTVLRFVTGIGLGAAMPNAVTMMGEFCPDRRRATVINLMFCGFPLGAAFGGFLAAWLIPHFGWRAVLMLGGITPLLLVLALLLKLPESVRYMVAKNHPVEKIRAVLARISSAAAQAGSFVMTEQAPQVAGKSGLRLGYLRGRRHDAHERVGHARFAVLGLPVRACGPAQRGAQLGVHGQPSHGERQRVIFVDDVDGNGDGIERGVRAGPVARVERWHVRLMRERDDDRRTCGRDRAHPGT